MVFSTLHKICIHVLYPNLSRSDAYLKLKKLQNTSATGHTALERKWLSSRPKDIFIGIASIFKLPTLPASHIQCIVFAITQWSLHGFPDRLRIYSELNVLLKLLYSWLLPENKHIRTNRGLWQIAYFLQHSIGLHNICFRQCRSSRFRLSARIANVNVHHAIAYKDFKSSHWTNYIKLIARLTIFPDSGRTDGGVYSMVTMQSRCWYCGAVKFLRLEASQPVFGPIKRLQEHLVHTRRNDLPASDRPRYKVWRNIAVHSLHLVILFVSNTRDAFHHEAACIRALQPTTQTEIGQAQTAIDSKPRLWQHKRPVPSRRRECAVNVELRLRTDPRKDPTQQIIGMTFIELCAFLLNSRGWSTKYVKFRIFYLATNFPLRKTYQARL